MALVGGDKELSDLLASLFDRVRVLENTVQVLNGLWELTTDQGTGGLVALKPSTGEVISLSYGNWTISVDGLGQLIAHNTVTTTTVVLAVP